MTKEEIKAILDHEREKKDRHNENRRKFYYEQRLDYTESDPHFKNQQNVLTQNSYLEHNRLYCHKEFDEKICFSFYYVPDDIYSAERNADPCPYPSEYSDGWDENNLCGIRRYIGEAFDFVEKRKENYQLFIKTILFLGMFALCGFANTKPLSALFALGILWIVMPTLHFFVPMYYLAPFSKRKRKLIKAYRYYLNWGIRESKRRHRLGLRNAREYGLMKPTFWNTIVHASYFNEGHTYFSN